MGANEMGSYDGRLRRANGDALRALAALAVVVLVWLISGFGLAGLDVTVFHMPLWAFTGLLCPWIAAIVAAVVLARRFRDPSDDDDVLGDEAAAEGLTEKTAEGVRS